MGLSPVRPRGQRAQHSECARSSAIGMLGFPPVGLVGLAVLSDLACPVLSSYQH